MSNRIIADERYIPRDFSIDFKSSLRHFERYFQCLTFLGKLGINEKWLDVACGSGYGSNLLTNFSSEVYGYDIDVESIEHANKVYANEYLFFYHEFSFLESYAFDVCFSVETIEHMTRNDALLFLTDLYRVISDDGIMIITTPIVEKTNLNPKNPNHKIEYSDKDFTSLLGEVSYDILDKFFVPTKFTDGETKEQGYYKCTKRK